MNPNKTLRYLRDSRNRYAEAFEAAQDDYYTGINAAAKSVFLGSPEDLVKAAEHATRVQAIVGTRLWPGDYWKTATVAETFLIQKDYAKAAELYQAAVDMAPTETGSHRSTWRQARRLLASLGAPEGEQARIKAPFAEVA